MRIVRVARDNVVRNDSAYTQLVRCATFMSSRPEYAILCIPSRSLSTSPSLAVASSVVSFIRLIHRPQLFRNDNRRRILFALRFTHSGHVQNLSAKAFFLHFTRPDTNDSMIFRLRALKKGCNILTCGWSFT